MAELVWERVKDFYKEEEDDLSKKLCGTVMRAKVPGGWLVRVRHSRGGSSDDVETDTMTFVQDPSKLWK